MYTRPGSSGGWGRQAENKNNAQKAAAI